MATVEDRKELIQEVLDAYPAKAKKNRAKHLNVTEADASDCGVKSNKKSAPGVDDRPWLLLCRSQRGGLGTG